MSELNEIDLLKSQADLLGITYHPNIGLDKLKEKIAFATSKEVVEEVVEAKPAKSEAQIRAEAAAEATKLIRIRLTCMDPSKADFHGEIITVGNDVVGNVKVFVPYRPEFYTNGYHVPNIIYKFLVERKYSALKTIKGPRGFEETRGVQANMYAIEVLPPLTEKELKELAIEQAAGKYVE